MRNNKGSVTVMLLLVLCALVMAVTLVVEVARLRIAENQAKRAVDAALFSALSSYDQDTKDDYGLFFRYGAQGMEGEIKETVEKSLRIGDESKAWDPYGFTIEKITIRAMFPLNDKDAFKHQIVEYMKYRGPLTLLGETLDKLKAFLNIQSTARVMKADLAVDQALKDTIMEIEFLKKQMAIINGYSDEKLQSLCREAKGWARSFEAIEDLEYDIDMLNERLEMTGFSDSAAVMAALQDKYEALESLRQEIRSSAGARYDELSPVVTAHLNAVNSVDRLTGLSGTVDQAIQRAKTTMQEEDEVIDDVRRDLEKKYESLGTYVDVDQLKQLKQQLTGNQRVIEPQLKALRKIKDRIEAPSDYPGVFSASGYSTCTFDPPVYPGPSIPQISGEAPDWDMVEKLLAELKGLKEDLAKLVDTDDTDKGPVTQCPGGRSVNTMPAEASANAGDPYDQANGTVLEAYDRIGSGDGRGNILAKDLAGGALNTSAAMAEALIINEYVLATFNHRLEVGTHSKHVLSETEVEYVLIGNKAPSVNAALAQTEMVAWRTAFNAVSFAVYCSEVRNIIDQASIALNGATGIPYPLWKGTLTGILAMLEACADMMQLYDGNSIPMVKYTTSELSSVKLLKDIAGRIGLEMGQDPSKSTAADSSGDQATGKAPVKLNLLVDYEDHLRAMLMYRVLLGQGDTILYRCQDLVYTNILAQRGTYDPSKHFSFIEADVQFTIKSFFPNLSGIRLRTSGIPFSHTLTVESGRGY